MQRNVSSLPRDGCSYTDTMVVVLKLLFDQV
jgi:hypothetical protein